MNDENSETIPDHAHRDPMTGARGAHPLGTGLGAAGMGAAGAAMGMIAGPVGGAIGAVVGAVAGGLIGKGTAEMVYPSSEEAHWRERLSTEPYFKPGHTYEDYASAYRAGYFHFDRSRSFEDAEPEVSRHFEAERGDSELEWSHARHAALAAWQRRQQHSDGVSANDEVSGRLLS